MSLVWKLLRQHISLPQFAGFFFANLFGMFIVLLGFQFYRDVLPVFTQGDSFMSPDYLIVSKRITTGHALSGREMSFSPGEVSEIDRQDFVRNTGVFTSAGYRIDACMGIGGKQVLNSEFFFESVPDGFIDVPLEQWDWRPGVSEVPIILPRTYMNMYNLGFAQNHSLPKISDGLVGMIDIVFFINGNGRHDEYKGKIIGFSNRLNTILVPQSFMDWSNGVYAAGEARNPARIIVEVKNPADERIAKFISDNEYEVEDDNLDAEKTTYFLKTTVSLVVVVGLVISVLSFYILMLSIYLLVQKNSSKLETLLLIGYRPREVAMPYQMLTVCLNAIVLAVVVIILYFVRAYYMGVIEVLFPDIESGTMAYTVALGAGLFLVVTLVNYLALYRKIMGIWRGSRR